MLYPVRRNINTLEYPIWCPSKILSKTGAFHSDKYIIECDGGLPTSFDVNVMNHLLSKAQINKSNVVEYKSMYSLLQELNINKSKKEYIRVQKAIDKYHKTIIHYKNNSFYITKDKYVSNPKISFIKNTSFGENLVVVFNETFIDLNNENYSLTLSTDIMREMKPYSKRLYEILVKSFGDGLGFNISINKLAEKLPIYGEAYKGWYKDVIFKSLDRLNSTLINNGSSEAYFMSKYKDILIFTKVE